MTRFFPIPLLLLAVIVGCERSVTPADSSRPDTPLSSAPDSTAVAQPQLTDSTIPPAVAGEDGWNYSQSSSADFDGDGSSERVVLTARVEMVRGRPAWDDGQPWQVYIEESDGTRTYLYARRVQLGNVTMRVALPADGRPASVVLLEHVPDNLALYEITYSSPGKTRTVEVFSRRVDPRGDTGSPGM